MDRSRYGIAPGPHLAHRFLWLIGLPTGLCLAPWAVMDLGPDVKPVKAMIVSAVLPAIGLAAVVAYRVVTRDYVRLTTYAPMALGAAVFAPTMIDLALDISQDPRAELVPLVPYGVGFLLPFLAFGGGVGAFIRL